MYSKLVKFICIFYKIRINLPPEIFRMIYFAFVHPHLLYGIEVYGNTTSNHLSKLITLNNKLLRRLQNKSIKIHNSELYKEYCTMPLHLLHQYQILLFMHQYVYRRNKLSVVFSAFLMKTKQYMIMILDTNKTFIPTPCILSLEKTATKYKGNGMIY